ncbi:polyhydroxyalkanoate depolymerase [Arenibaculum pallidiluteum]|uniref:polyhydroxyalkanoate depolymerase n=1 Tax=Arenibaculum pallidiluteum TaxID=2812559 RepID=UPI001A97913A|nr:polyhydroxyalkanoate depolymerase [Arenibaculum pallidiluteum]
MLYQLYDLQHAALYPMRLLAEATQATFQNPFLPASYTRLGRSIAAGAELIERTTRRFGKPAWGLAKTRTPSGEASVAEVKVLRKPFCDLVHFKRSVPRQDPKVLLVAPMSGHYATLLRGTVDALLPEHEVYVTDWIDARQVPLSQGRFDLDEYVAYVMEFIRHLGPDVHVIAVCQPAVPVLAAVSLMSQADDPMQPLSMVLMGGPIDTAAAPTVVTQLAETRPLSWFERNVVTSLPVYYPGGLRRVYPGFVQLTGFMSMNLDRHVGEHLKLFEHLVRGDGESAEQHRRFYDEYLSVMDLPAEFYLQTVSTVFQERALARGRFTWRGQAVDPGAITRTALMTVEGELDDISAPGQTRAAHRLCSGLRPEQRQDYCQKGVGHYGIFNGRRFREMILPRIRNFIRNTEQGASPAVAAE